MLLRELGESECIYDYEYKHNRHLFVSSILFESKLNLLNIDKFVLIKSIHNWKLLNPLLRVQIVNVNQKKYFKLADDDDDDYNRLDESSQLNNVFIYKLITNDKNNLAGYWRLFYERELNMKACSKLWRLYLINLNENKYSMILNMHHALTDARNKYDLMIQLLGIIEMVAIDQNYKVNLVNHVSILDNVEIMTHKMYGDLNDVDVYLGDDRCKIPIDFARTNNSSNKLIIENNDRFESILSNSMQIWIKDLQNMDFKTKFVYFKIESNILKKLIDKCKLNKMKLSGCLNMINILATHLTYKKFYLTNHEFTNEIYYHLMVSLRPYLNLNNTQMGFYATCLNFKYKFDNYVQNLDEFLSEKFWYHAKRESNELHKRLESREHIKNGIGAGECEDKTKCLLNNIDVVKFNNGGGVHFAISNLGQLSRYTFQSNLIEIDQFNYQISMDENRWSSILFNGISTNSNFNHLDWGITFNSISIREEIIGFKLNLIKEIFYKLI